MLSAQYQYELARPLQMKEGYISNPDVAAAACPFLLHCSSFLSNERRSSHGPSVQCCRGRSS